MNDNTNAIEIDQLSTTYFTEEGEVNAVDGVSFAVPRGEVFGIVGESGSGKSVTVRSIMDLIQPPGEITGGSIRLQTELKEKITSEYPNAISGDTVDLRKLPENVRQWVNGREISMIFQDPNRSFNKSFTVGHQIAEAVETNARTDLTNLSNKPLSDTIDSYGMFEFMLDSMPSKSYVSEESMQRAIELLRKVGISDPKLRAEQYPHEFSGGMLQRAMIAQAIAGEPKVLIADEPTSALDVTIQTQILDLLDEMQRELNMSVILISHNLGVVARMCDKVGVMYAGEIVEKGNLTDIFENSVHPYTDGLINAIPSLEQTSERLDVIDGNVPNLIDMGSECRFIDRCPKAMEKCRTEPPTYSVDEEHKVSCYLADETQKSKEDNEIPMIKEFNKNKDGIKSDGGK